MLRNIFIGILLMVPVVINAQQTKKQIRQGNREYSAGKYNEAELHYRKALEKDPQSGKATYNLGDALYKQDQYEPATTKFESLLRSEKDPATLDGYYYNLGNSYFKTQKLEKCIEAYKQSLRLNPTDQDAKHNLFLAQSMLKQQQQQQQQKNKQNQNKDQQNRDQQNQQNQQQQQQQQQKQDKQEGQKEVKISKADAERLLEAMEQDEKDVQKQLEEKKMQVRKVPVEKAW
jgi:Ca-activated chloride channel family protein